MGSTGSPTRPSYSLKPSSAKLTQWVGQRGTKQITNFTNRDGVNIDSIKNYGQINMATLKTACERFCKVGEADAETRAKQNNKMMSMCLANSLSKTAT